MISTLDLALTGVACALWYFRPALGPWPLLLIAAGRLVRTLTSRHIAWRRTPFDWPLLLFFLSAAIGTWLAYDQVAGWGKFWVIVGGLALYDSLAFAPERVRVGRWRIAAVRVLLALLPAVIACYFLLTNDWPAWMGKLPWLDPAMRWFAAWQPDLPGHRLHPNVAGGLMAALLPLQAAAVGRAKAGWSLIGLTAFGLLMTASRGAWIALAAVAALWAVWRLWGRRWPRRVWLALIAGLILAGAFCAALALLFGPELFPGGRLELLRNSLDLALDYPFTGLGLAGFQMAYSSYVLLLHVGHTIHSHNLLLNLWLEQGLAGLAAFVWLLVESAVISRQWSVVGGRQSVGSGQWAVAALMTIAVIVIHGLVDDAFYGSRGVLLLFVPFALLARAWAEDASTIAQQGGRGAEGRATALEIASALSLRGPSPSASLRTWLGPKPSPASEEIALLRASQPHKPLLAMTFSSAAALRVAWTSVVMIFIAALILVLALLPGTRAMFQANLGALLQTRVELSVYRWPEWPIQDAVRRVREAELRPAMTRYAAALALDPRNAAANRRLGQIELSLGQYAAAWGHLEAAYASAPRQRATRQLLGESYAIAGDVGRAAALWRTVDVSQGQLSLRAWWYEHIGERENARLVREASQ
jgi:hypothetical protein